MTEANFTESNVPSVDGIPLTELPEEAKKYYDKILELANESKELEIRLVGKKGALAEFQNILRDIVEDYKDAKAQGGIEANG